MAPQDGRRGGPESGGGEFAGRDLLVGRPEGAEGRRAASAAGTAQATTSPQPGAQDDAIREILETVRATAARIDALREAPGPEHDTAEALARETAALTQAAEDARGALARAVELAARQDGQAASGTQALDESVAALRAQGEALDKRIRAAGTQAQANARQAKETAAQAEAAAQGMAGMKEAASALDGRIHAHGETILRIVDRHRRRPWSIGLSVAAASLLSLMLGAMLQREAGVMSFGDPRQEWIDHVEEHYAPALAACTSRARHHDRIIICQLHVGPARGLTVPLHDDVNLTEVPPEEASDPTAGR